MALTAWHLYNNNLACPNKISEYFFVILAKQQHQINLLFDTGFELVTLLP